ncbi:MAG: hypothetical protein L3J96_02510, partial [Thermoplasmata archaeon]|nr:hypothetical protein [Thermoplasmata archaeon]
MVRPALGGIYGSFPSAVRSSTDRALPGGSDLLALAQLLGTPQSPARGPEEIAPAESLNNPPLSEPPARSD